MAVISTAMPGQQTGVVCPPQGGAVHQAVPTPPRKNNEKEGREFWLPSTSQTHKKEGKNVSILPEGKRNHLSPNVPLAPLAITSVQWHE